MSVTEEISLNFTANTGVLSNLQNRFNSLKTSVQDIGSSFQTVGAGITGVGTKLTAAVTAPIAGLATFGVKYNSTMQDLETSFKVMLGSGEKAKKMTADLIKMGASTPFESSQLAEYTKTLLAFGYTQKNVLPIMSRLGDISLGNNEKMSSMTRTMGQINALGKLQGGDLNQLIGQGWNPLNEIMKKTGETTEKIRKRMSAGKVTYKEVEQALISATSKGGQFYKGMAEGSKTFSGQLSTLSDTFSVFAGEITRPIFDGLMKVLPKIISVLGSISAKFKSLSPIMKTVILVTLGVISAIGPLLIVGGMLISAIGSIITGFGAIAGVVGAIFSPIGLVVVAIIGIITTIGVFIAVNKNLRSSIFSVFSGIASKIKEVAGFIKTNFGDIKKSFGDFVKGIKTGDFSSFYESMKKLVPESVRGKLLGIIEKIKSLRDWVSNVKGKIVEFGNTLFKAFSKAFSSIGNSFKNMDFSALGEVFNDLKGTVSALMPIFEAFGKAFVLYIGIVMGHLSGLLRALPNIIAMVGNIVGAIGSFAGIIIGIFTFDGDMIAKSFSSLWKNIKGIFKNAIEAIKKYLQGFVETFLNFIGNLDKKIGKAFSGGILGTIAKKMGINLSIDKENPKKKAKKELDDLDKDIQSKANTVKLLKKKYDQQTTVEGTQKARKELDKAEKELDGLKKNYDGKESKYNKKYKIDAKVDKKQADTKIKNSEEEIKKNINKALKTKKEIKIDGTLNDKKLAKQVEEHNTKIKTGIASGSIKASKKINIDATINDIAAQSKTEKSHKEVKSKADKGVNGNKNVNINANINDQGAKGKLNGVHNGLASIAGKSISVSKSIMINASVDSSSALNSVSSAVNNLYKMASNVNIPVNVGKITTAMSQTISKASKSSSKKKTKKHALGTNYTEQGMALVGEQGAELVNLPRGSQVYNSSKTHSMLSNNNRNVNVTINGSGMGVETRNKLSYALRSAGVY